MALILPRVFIPHDRTAAVEVSRAGAVDAEEINLLESIAPPHTALAEHHLPLKNGRWAVGRTGHEGTLWRIGRPEDRERLFHPAWLWRDDDAFAHEGDDNAHVAPALPLRNLIRDAMPLFGNVYNTCACVAATIAALRRRKRPVAIVPLWQEDHTDIGAPARSFALAILTSMPPSWRPRMRISTLQVAPRASAWDLVFVAQEAKGFGHVHADAPAGVESDIVAAYILDRLLNKDPEAVEACAYLTSRESPESSDPWADGVRAHLAGGVPGVSALGEQQLDEDPDGAVRAVCRRLEAGASMRGSALSDLAAVTARTQDVKPWKLLAKRAEPERSGALVGVLPHLDPATTSPELCRAMNPCGMGDAAGSWAAFLIDVLRSAEDATVPLELLSNVVGSRHTLLDAPTRASLWQEVTVALVERHESSLAASEMLSANGRRVGAEGGTTIVHSFLALPTGTRTAGALRAVIDALASTPNPDHAMAQLWRGLSPEPDEDGPSPQHAALAQWARIRTGRYAPSLKQDQLLESIRNEAAAFTWAELVGPLANGDLLADLLRPARPEDPARVHSYYLAAEQSRASTLGTDAVARLEDIAIWLPEAGPLVEPLARELLTEAFPTLKFPAKHVAAAVAELAEQPGVSHVWMWLAVTAQEPGAFNEDTVDATVVAFGEAPPTDDADRVICQQAAERLGSSEAWSWYDLARWVARLCMAPDGDASGFCVALANQMLRAVARRPDGLMVVTQITREFLQLTPDHVALRVFLAKLLPHTWNEGPPPAYLTSIRTSRLGPGVRALWLESLGLDA